MRTALRTTTLALAALSFSSALFAQPAAPVLSVDEKLDFLRHAKIVASRPIGKGTTGALRLTLSDGTLTHDAAFQRVDVRASPIQGVAMSSLMFVDSYRYNIAAWEVARLLGLEDMTPPTVQRTYRGQIGALSWWVDDVLMDEAERERTETTPPDGLALSVARQRQRMLVFAELVHDTDRNKGNVVYTRDWRVVMLDFTRAFRLKPELRAPATLVSVDRSLLEKLRSLDRAVLMKVARRHLTGFEADALMKRRDLIVARFEQLLATRGEAGVLF